MYTYCSTHRAFLVPNIVGMYVSGRYCLFGKFTGTCPTLLVPRIVSSHEKLLFLFILNESKMPELHESVRCLQLILSIHLISFGGQPHDAGAAYKRNDQYQSKVICQSENTSKFYLHPTYRPKPNRYSAM